MKKIFTLALLLLGISLAGFAQDKKTWDFSKGWSDETLANLEAGSEWTKDGSSWKETGKFGEGDFVANGVQIKELVGLKRSSAGLFGSNNYLLTGTTFRLNRANQQLIFPSLKNGQTLTVVGRSANATAENRGVLPMYDYMVRIDDDPTNNIMLGGSVAGSKGTYTFVYQIQTDAAGEVPVGIKMNSSTGGIDFTLFMIDDGDPIKVAKIAYLYAGAYAEGAVAALQAREETEVTLIDVTSASVTAEGLQEYTVTVIDPSVPADNAVVSVVKEAMPFTPTLNMNNQLYPAWGYGEAVMAAEGVGVVKNSKSSLLSGVTIDDVEGLKIVGLGEADFPAVVLGEYFAGDEVALVDMTAEGAAGTNVVAHLHNAGHNAYAYLPWTSGSTELLLAATNVLAESKQEVTAAATPKLSQEYKDMFTLVSIAAGIATQPKVKFYYTTDGSVPTVEKGTLYEGPVRIDAECTFQAVAIAEGYTVSEPASLDVKIYTQPKTPQIAAEYGEGKTTITLSTTEEDVDIYFNFESTPTNDLGKSTKYTEPFTIDAPQTINAFVVAGGILFSEIATERHAVKDARVVIDVAAHFAAKQWTADNNVAGKAVANGKGMFSWGASAASMYIGEGTKETVIDPETGDETEVVTHTDADLREYEVVDEPGLDGEGNSTAEWQLKSRGTCLIWQNTGSRTSNFGDDSNYNPAYSTDVDPLFPQSSYDIQFYKFYAGETANASIETKKAYQAPLDVVVLANMAGGPLLVQVSKDGTTWETIGTIAKGNWSRMWSKYTSSYDGTDEVYVRVTQESTSAGAKVFDIYIANAGEQSAAKKAEYDQEYEQLATGISTVQNAAQRQQAVYNLNGVRQQRLQRGLNIVVMPDGSVRKVVIK